MALLSKLLLSLTIVMSIIVKAFTSDYFYKTQTSSMKEDSIDFVRSSRGSLSRLNQPIGHLVE